MARWHVRCREGQWQVLDRGVWHDTYPCLVDAHTAATQYAIATDVFKPGFLTWFKELAR